MPNVTSWPTVPVPSAASAGAVTAGWSTDSALMVDTRVSPVGAVAPVPLAPLSSDTETRTVPGTSPVAGAATSAIRGNTTLAPGAIDPPLNWYVCSEPLLVVRSVHPAGATVCGFVLNPAALGSVTRT